MQYVKVAGVAEVVEGTLLPIAPNGLKLMLTKVDGSAYATQRKCPHLGFNLCRGKVEGHAVVCPLHKARFDLATGAIERDPRLLFIGMKAKSGLTTYPVRVEGVDVLVGV